MKYNLKDVYRRVYGKLKTDNENMTYRTEQTLMHYYVANHFDKYEDLLELLWAKDVTSESDAVRYIMSLVSGVDTVISPDDNFQSICSKGRRLFQRACSEVHNKPYNVMEAVMKTYTDIDVFYVLYHTDGNVRWIYTDTDITSKEYPLSGFPEGYKELLTDSLKVVRREENV